LEWQFGIIVWNGILELLFGMAVWILLFGIAFWRGVRVCGLRPRELERVECRDFEKRFAS
jgi:hypothetical protein